MQIELPSIPLQQITDPITNAKGVKLYVLRTDLNHPHISGNKLYKLKYNLEAACRANKNCLLTFGGAFSNHIAAVAAAGKAQGFKTIGIIRGEELQGKVEENPTLKFADDSGMHLDFISRERYQRKDEGEFVDSLKQQFGTFFLL